MEPTYKYLVMIMHLPSMIMQLDSILDTQQTQTQEALHLRKGMHWQWHQRSAPTSSRWCAGTTVAFTGAMQTTDQSINIINNDGLNNVGRRWNLVSNPFPSYIEGNTDAGKPQLFDANSAVIDSERLAVYGWNGSDYDIYNLACKGFFNSSWPRILGSCSRHIRCRS